MSLYYKIIFLHFKMQMPIPDIAMILEHEIRKSGINRRKHNGIILKDTPVHFVSRVIAVELMETVRLKESKELILI